MSSVSDPCPTFPYLTKKKGFPLSNFSPCTHARLPPFKLGFQLWLWTAIHLPPLCPQALLFLFSILRKVAWDYGRLALVTDADR